MAWSDILGAIGSAAGGIGGLVGGPIGGAISGVGSLVNLGGQIAANETSSGQSAHAADVTGRATDAALGLAQQQAKEESQTFSKAMGLIPQQTDAYNKAVAALGPAPAAPTFDAGDVETRASQLLPQYMQEADYTMQDMFGKDMGSLMRAGLDDSTYGIQARANLGATSADLHRKLYNQAYTDALSYVTGIYDPSAKAHDQAMSDRAAALKEAMDPYTSAFGDYSALFSKSGSGSDALTAADKLASSLSSQAATGAQSLATGAAASAAKSGVSDILAGLKDIWGNSNSANNSGSDPMNILTNTFPVNTSSVGAR
jgi:hypothetical protein